MTGKVKQGVDAEPSADPQPEETDNRERPGIDPEQNISQDPEVDYTKAVHE